MYIGQKSSPDAILKYEVAISGCLKTANIVIREPRWCPETGNQIQTLFRNTMATSGIFGIKIIASSRKSTAKTIHRRLPVSEKQPIMTEQHQIWVFLQSKWCQETWNQLKTLFWKPRWWLPVYRYEQILPKIGIFVIEMMHIGQKLTPDDIFIPKWQLKLQHRVVEIAMSSCW